MTLTLITHLLAVRSMGSQSPRDPSRFMASIQNSMRSWRNSDKILRRESEAVDVMKERWWSQFRQEYLKIGGISRSTSPGSVVFSWSKMNDDGIFAMLNRSPSFITRKQESISSRWCLAWLHQKCLDRFWLNKKSGNDLWCHSTLLFSV